MNGRGLDVRLRLPPGLEMIEPQVRDAVARSSSRGSITLTLNLQHEAPAMAVRINRFALAGIARAIEEVRAVTGAAEARADGILTLRGVMEFVEETPDSEALTARNAAVLSSLDTALEMLNAARDQEGQRLASIVADQIAAIARLVDAVETSPARSPEAIRARLEENVRRLVEASPALDPARLHQEAVLIATRADVEEEVQRLKAHIRAAEHLLQDAAPVGRKFDFLAQELNREANTLTSKSIDIASSQAGLALKTVIDQLREQVQNIE